MQADFSVLHAGKKPILFLLLMLRYNIHTTTMSIRKSTSNHNHMLSMIGRLNFFSSLRVVLVVLTMVVVLHPAAVVVVEGATFRAEIVELPDASVPGVSGTVVAFEDGKAIGYGGFLTGLQSDLEAATCTAENGCGVHVHSGSSCESTATQGGHYYDPEVVDVDPWMEARYSSDADGSATFSGVVIPGATAIEGRAFVGEFRSFWISCSYRMRVHGKIYSFC